MPSYQPKSRRAVLLMLPSAVVVAAVAAEGIREVRNPAGNPDPGGGLLHALAADPVFAALPPGAVRTGLQEEPALYRSGGLFGSSAWDGPAVNMTFISARPARDVYSFYADRAHDTGWTPWQHLESGLADIWAKRISGNRHFLQLFQGFITSTEGTKQGGSAGRYTLNAS